MNFESDLPEQLTIVKMSKFQESFQGNLSFLKGLFYLIKKIFML